MRSRCGGITPSAARGILDAIYWKPAIRWVIDRIQVCSPVVFTNILIEWDHNRTGSLPDQLERSCNLSKGKTVCGHTRFQFAADIFYIQAIVPGDLIKPGEVGVNRLEGKGIGMLLEDITCQFSRTPGGQGIFF
mgnify:CR=1 FL=1